MTGNERKDLPTRFVWHPSRGRRHRSDLLHLAPWAERRVDVIVAEAQALLVLREHGVHEVLLPGIRSLSVGSLAAGWARQLENEPRADCQREGCIAVSSADLLLYVPTDALPDVPWAMRLEGLRGVATIHVSDPARYYDSFLRHSEDLEEQALVDTMSMMLQGVFERWLEKQGAGYESGSVALAEELRIAASAALASVGVELTAFECRSTREAQQV